MTFDPVRLGKAVREARNKRGMMLIEVARVSGHSIGALSKIEMGQRVPSLDMLCGICAALGVSPSDILKAAE